MFESLATYLTQNGNLTPDELEWVRQVAFPKKLRKRQYLLQEGEVSHYNSFVAKGCLRLFRVDATGEEHIMRFAIENYWTSDYQSYQSGEPSKYNIEALEDCELLLIDKKDFDGLVASIPNFQSLVERLVAKNFGTSQERIYANISASAEERYHNFVKSFPQIYKRIPLHMIASFLGLSRETLSRVRKQDLQKD